VPESEHDGDLVKAYSRLLDDPDPSVRLKAAQEFHSWEAAAVSADPNAPPPAAWPDEEFILARTRIVTHYFRPAAWLEDD